jgi:hypothetical protein
MYGLVNQGLQDFVTSVGGDVMWRQVRNLAGSDAELFVSMETYPDSMTYDLVDAASQVLELPVDELLRAFGRHWILYTARRGYGAIFETMGRTLPEFLTNLDMMHTRLCLSMPELRPPSFVSEPIDEDWLRIEYRSDRDGLAPMAIGLLEGLAEMYGLDVVVRQTLDRQLGADHDEFVLGPLSARNARGALEECQPGSV